MNMKYKFISIDKLRLLYYFNWGVFLLTFSRSQAVLMKTTCNFFLLQYAESRS